MFRLGMIYFEVIPNYNYENKQCNIIFNLHNKLPCKKHALGAFWDSYHFKNILRLKLYLSQEALGTVDHAFITLSIDYCNSLLYGISMYSWNRLQRIENYATRMEVCASKYDHVTPIFQKLYWLQVDQRIQLKVLLTTYKAVSLA